MHDRLPDASLSFFLQPGLFPPTLILPGRVCLYLEDFSESFDYWKFQSTELDRFTVWFNMTNCAILQNRGRLTNIYVRSRGLHVVWVCLAFSVEINNYWLEIQSHFLILQYLNKKPECMLVMPDASVTNLATDCGGILSEIYIWTIPGYKSLSSKLLPLELSIDGDPARTEQIGLGILIQLKIN